MDSAPLPEGFQAAGLSVGIKANEQSDLGLLIADEARPATAVYTKSLLQGAHLTLCRDHLARSGQLVRAVLVNSGNANCATGEEGVQDAYQIASELAEHIGCPEEQVLYLSTGVIGARLPVDKILGGLGTLVEAASPTGMRDFAASILTTDTRRKLQAFQSNKAEGRYQVVGVAKGAGMIHPDMATMLAFLLTDAELPAETHSLLGDVSRRSFQRLSVDGDTSPNDTVILWGGGRGGESPAGLGSRLVEISEELCRMIAADGEGATRLVTIKVRRAPDEEGAARMGRVIATSPLVKTAVYGRDPNWGRILSAAARSDVPFDPAQARLHVGGACVYEAGRPLPENEAQARESLLSDIEVRIELDLAAGTAEAEVWTCDFSPDYVRINAEYRT